MRERNPSFPDAFVSTMAELEEGVEVGPGAVVHRGVRIGSESHIGPHCVIGQQGPGEWDTTVIGAGATIRSHTVVYLGCHVGSSLETGHHVVIREGTVAGENLRVGNFSDIEGDCQIGDYSRFHGYVHVGKGARVGSFVWLYPQVTLLNDPLPPSEVFMPVVVEDGAVVCTGAIIYPGIRVGTGAFVAATVRLATDVPPWMVVGPPDGCLSGAVDKLFHLESGTRHPWMRHFRRGFPPDAVPRIEELLAERRRQRK